MLRLDPTGATFTSTHVILTRLCLLARAYSLSLPVLDKDVFFFPTHTDHTFLQRSEPIPCASHEISANYITVSSGLTRSFGHREYLKYFLYGGMIYGALKEWGKALHFLTIAISAPSVNTVSLIMVEAYKKWVLFQLLDKGDVCYFAYLSSKVRLTPKRRSRRFPRLCHHTQQNCTNLLPGLMMPLPTHSKRAITTR